MALAPTPKRPPERPPERPAERPAERPGFSASFGVEPRVGSYLAANDLLRDYRFAPVQSPALITFGLRARVWLRSGWLFGAAMNYGFTSHERSGNPVPTTITRIETTLGAGNQLGAGFDVELQGGFSVHTMSVGSPDQSGALVYLGPVVQPRIGWVAPLDPFFLRLSVGYSLMFPVGEPHDQVLWEDEFRQFPIHGALFGVETGFVAGRRRFRWRARRPE